MGIPQTDQAGAYHSHPPSSWASFSIQDMTTAVNMNTTNSLNVNKPSYVVGTNTAGDGEVVRFTPNTRTVPPGWQPWSKWWGGIREMWYDWTAASFLGVIEPVADLGSDGELVNWTQQCPTQVY
jgi:hypothetical protein